MSEEVLITIVNGCLTLAGIIITAVVTNGLTKYRIGQLELKVEKHNSIIERVYKLEQKVEDM